MPFASSRGYSSLTLQHDTAQMLNRRYAETGRDALIFFVSDLDPSGLDLQRAWEEELDNFRVRYRLMRIGLTPEQVRGLDNPRLRRGIDVKPSDSRSASYIREYGDRCWEADILPAATIRAWLDAFIETDGFDARLWARRSAEIDRARKLL